jgi:hypothetical protein
MADARLKEVRRGLKQRLRLQGMVLREAIWHDLVRTHIVELLSREAIDFESLVVVYLRREQKARTALAWEIAGHARRDEVLAAMLAGLLERACGVAAFREDVLAGRLLSRRQLPGWIEAEARRESAVGALPAAASPPRKPLDWLFATADPDALSAPGNRAQLPDQETRGDAAAAAAAAPIVLEYSTPDGVVARISFGSGGHLGRLKRIVSGRDGVCALSGWSEPEAVSFVLCGRVPTQPLARVLARPGAYPALDRVELSLAAELSAKEVAALYRAVRPLQRAVRSQRIGKKQLALALFADEAKFEARSWKTLRRRWNQRYPKWRYKAGGKPGARRFARAAKRAWSRVSGEKWQRY